MAGTTSIAAISSKRFGRAEARHLLARAGFGGTLAEADRLARLGPEAAVDELVDFHRNASRPAAGLNMDPDLIRPPTAQERQAYRRARRDGDEDALEAFRKKRQLSRQEDRKQFQRLGRWWIGRMIDTPCPLEEKLALLWHSHFASSYREVRDSYLMFRQNEFFRENAAGDIRKLVRGIIRDPAMLIY